MTGGLPESKARELEDAGLHPETENARMSRENWPFRSTELDGRVQNGSTGVQPPAGFKSYIKNGGIQRPDGLPPYITMDEVLDPLKQE